MQDTNIYFPAGFIATALRWKNEKRNGICVNRNVKVLSSKVSEGVVCGNEPLDRCITVTATGSFPMGYVAYQDIAGGLHFVG